MNVEVLLAGSVGALAVFVLGIVREWWRNERERRGLLVLLLAEMEHNTEVIHTVAERVDVDRPIEDMIGNANFATLKMRTWSKVQGRAAALQGRFPRSYRPLRALLRGAEARTP